MVELGTCLALLELKSSRTVDVIIDRIIMTVVVVFVFFKMYYYFNIS